MVLYFVLLELDVDDASIDVLDSEIMEGDGLVMLCVCVSVRCVSNAFSVRDDRRDTIRGVVCNSIVVRLGCCSLVVEVDGANGIGDVSMSLSGMRPSSWRGGISA